MSGLEAVLADGELIELGGPIRKDVAGYDLLGLLVGSEGTLAVITAAWLKLLPAPEAALPLVAVYPDTASGCAAIEPRDRLRASGRSARLPRRRRARAGRRRPTRASCRPTAASW